MSSQVFGVGTALNPAILIDGVEYSLVFKFFAHPTNRTFQSSFIVSGVVKSVTSLSGNRKRLVMERDFLRSSTTVVNGPGDSFEKETSHLCGTNICATCEPQRIYSWNEPTAYRGGDARNRVIEADAAWIDIDTAPKAFMVTEATPCADRQSPVNYVGETPHASSFEIITNFNDVSLTREAGATLIFTPASADNFSDCAVTWQNTSALTNGPVTRKIFQRGDPLANDEDYYPSDASFTLSSQEYWYSPRGNSFRFGTIGMGSVGADIVYVTFYQQVSALNSYIAVESPILPMVIETDDAPNYYDGSADEVALCGVTVIDDTEVIIDIIAGSGSIELRSSSEAGARVVALTWNSSADITDLLQRDTDGGIIGSLGTIGGAYSYPFQVKANLVYPTVYISHRQNSSSDWNDEDPVTIDHDSSRLSLGTFNSLKFAGINARIYNIPIGCESTLSARRVSVFTGLTWSQTYTLPVATAITSVVNSSTNSNMNSASPTTLNTSRDIYSADATHITLFSETVGDLVVVNQAAPGSAPTGPGDPPRTNNQVNYGAGGSDPDENIVNWCDVVIIHDPNDEFPSTPGTVISFHRNCVFDSQDPPDLEYDVKNRDGSDYTVLSVSEYKAFYPEGLFPIKKSFVDSLAITGDESMCARPVGPKFAQRGGISALTINDIVNCQEALDNVWLDAGVGSALATEVSGHAGGGSVGCVPYVTNWTCTGGEWEADDVDYGVIKSSLHGLSDILDSSGMPFGSHFFNLIEWPILVAQDTALRTLYRTTDDSILPSCGFQPPKNAHDVVSAGDYYTALYPVNKISPSLRPTGQPMGITNPNYFGGGLLPLSGLNPGIYSAGVSSEFGFQGFAFTPAGFFANLPDGVIVEEAYAIIRMDDMQRIAWDQEWEIQPNGTVRVRYRQEGSSVIEYDGPLSGIGGTLVHNPSPTPPTSGVVGLALMGRKRNSKRIPLCPPPDTFPLAHNDFVSFGSGIATSSIDSGKWRKVSVKSLLQLLIVNRNSGIADWEIWPTVGGATPNDNPGALANFIDGNMPTRDVTFIPGPGDGTYGFSSTQSGVHVIFGVFQMGAIKCRLRFPSGLLSDEVIATNQTAMIPGWS